MTAVDLKPESLSQALFPSLEKLQDPAYAAKIAQETVQSSPEPIQDYKPSRPSLPHPSQKKASRPVGNIIAEFIDTILKVREDSIREKHFAYEQDLKNMLAEERKALQAKLDKKAQEKKAGFWGFLKKVATCILSGISLVAGAALIATGVGSVAGGLLIGSGVAGIASLVLTEVGVHPLISGGLALVSAALGIAGGIIGFSQIAHQLPKMIATIANAILNVGTGMTDIGIGIHQYKIAILEQKLCDFELHTSQYRHEIDETTNAMNKVIKNLESVQQTAAETFQAEMQQKRLITQQILSNAGA